MLKISIITVVYNACKTIEDTIHSVLSQSYQDIEYIIVDGMSSDGTLEVIQKYADKITHILSEPDNGIYDAMNKGIALATGDIVGILNADDVYSENECLQIVADEFELKKVDSVFADLVYVRPNDLNKVVRYYSSEKFNLKRFAHGWMPAHPTFCVRRECYKKYGNFKIDYKIAADYELLVRFLYSKQISYSYINRVMIKMRTGGISTKNIFQNWILNQEIIRACRENGIQTNIFKVLSKYFIKSLQLVQRPK